MTVGHTAQDYEAWMECQIEQGADREPQPGDGPNFHAEHAAWEARNRGFVGSSVPATPALSFIEPGDPEWPARANIRGFAGSSVPEKPELDFDDKLIELLEAMVAEWRETNRILRGDEPIGYTLAEQERDIIGFGSDGNGDSDL